MAIYEVFRTYHYPIYTIEPFSDQLCSIYLDGKPNEQVENHISIKDCLAIFDSLSELTDEYTLLMYKEVVDMLSTKWASNAQALGPRLALYQKGLLTFKNEVARQFANEEWLEWYVYQQVKNIQDKLVTIQDLAINVHVFRKLNEKEVKNELNAVAVVNNKLHLIECKTKGMSNDGDDTFYELESIRDLLDGIQARAMLISFRPFRHHDVTRASDLDLALIGPDQLSELHTYLYTNGF